ncbi:hypothetical protein ACO0LD_29570 [Undibacterium sp. Ji83W]|uniref:hypothetical protein n=1 Tax=Undibacterium sp. Ji83W TaxID=3413043 RepID=UPI003BF0A7F1
MAVHTPIASAIAASSQPSFAFFKLQDLRASFERLRGLQIDALKAIGFDTLLDDLASICDALTERDRINADCASPTAPQIALRTYTHDLRFVSIFSGPTCARVPYTNRTLWADAIYQPDTDEKLCLVQAC